jgi:hypothetical protein
MTALPTLRQRLHEWREEGGPPAWTIYNRMGRRRLILGGGRTRGWMLVPHLSVDLRQLTFGVSWQKEAFEDPDPLVSLHVPGACLWVRIYQVNPGYRPLAHARGEAA